MPLVALLGACVIRSCTAIGSFVLFLLHACRTIRYKQFNTRALATHIERIGINSLPITLITGTSAGAVLAIQTYKGLRQFGGESLLGPLVALSMIREFGPVLTALMVTGRSGSAIAAELGTMKITEQIDALRTLCIDPFRYLVAPRIVAGIVVLPLLAFIAMAAGIVGGYAVSTHVLGINGDEFIATIRTLTELSDIRGGLIKAGVFGLILTWSGAYKGYMANGGARGVGSATTQSVVLSSTLIIIADYFLTVMLFGPQ